MIRAVGNKKLDLSKEEEAYMKSLKEAYGNDCFNGCFSSNENGMVTFVSPPLNKVVPMPVLFFLLNLSFNQRLRFLDKHIDKKIKELSNDKID